MRRTHWQFTCRGGQTEVDCRHREMVACLEDIGRGITGEINYLMLGFLVSEFMELCSIHAQAEDNLFLDLGCRFDGSGIDQLADELDCAVSSKASPGTLAAIVRNLSSMLMIDILRGAVEMARIPIEPGRDHAGLWATRPSLQHSHI